MCNLEMRNRNVTHRYFQNYIYNLIYKTIKTIKRIIYTYLRHTLYFNSVLLYFKHHFETLRINKRYNYVICKINIFA